MNIRKSSLAFAKAKELMPGGVSSPVRAFGSVGGTPRFITRAKGPRVWDIDGNDYIDYVGSWGPAILGHAHPEVMAALTEALRNGTSFGAPTELETTLASLIVGAIPSIDMVRFVSSGTEATMSAIRLARGVTERPKILKFEGCYNGHADSLLVKSGSGAATFGVPTSAGVPPSLAAETIVTLYNDIDQVATLLSRSGDQIAAVIVEPVAGNMGCVPPKKGFLKGLRELTEKSGALLIFDEVMTGFRLAFGGAQSIAGIRPDITCLGKIVGGGLPVGAYGGSREIMEKISPLGPVYQAGTLSGNPLAMTAGIKTLQILKRDDPYAALEEKTKKLCDGISRKLASQGIAHQINRAGSMWSLFFTQQKVVDFSTATSSDTERFRRMFHCLLEMGVYLAPSPYESVFMSTAHSDEEIATTIECIGAWARSEG